MRKTATILTILSLTLMLAPAVLATNGTNLIGIGPISRSMGGGGVAAPQDAISAIFANPAAMCFGPFCPGSSVDFAGTWFDPSVSGRAVNAFGPNTDLAGDSQFDPFVVPAVGVTSPINERWRFGIGFYGISGLGADYRGTPLSPFPAATTGQPILYTQLQTLKFAPNLAWLITPNFSLGLSVEVVWQNLDLGSGASHGYTLGAQVGALYHLDKFNFGISYVTPEKVTHDNVFAFGGTFNDLEIESPQTVKLGVSFEPNTSWLLEVNTRWYDWSGAAGYGDFGWDDQWVFAIGGQWKATEKWTFRLGYNYGEQPLNDNSGFNPLGSTNVQGISVPNPLYEGLRVLGFPAIVEQHFTGGVGYNLTETWILNLSFMYAPEETFTETSGPTTLEVKLKEWSSTFGLTWYF